MDDRGIQERISALIDREHELRTSREEGRLDATTELHELSEVEVELDQCWDLLRQRRARRDYGEDPEEARARPPSVVEHYLQ